MKYSVCVVLVCLTALTHAATIQKPICPAVCFIYCPFGNVLDGYGCATCRCHAEPQTTQGTATITKCAPVLCEIYCPRGFLLDSISGCPRCECN